MATVLVSGWGLMADFRKFWVWRVSLCIKKEKKGRLEEKRLDNIKESYYEKKKKEKNLIDMINKKKERKKERSKGN